MHLHGLQKPPLDVLLSCPRLVHADASGPIDGVHELIVWRIRAGRPLTTESADAMVHTVFSTLVPGVAYRCDETNATSLVDAQRLSLREEDERDGLLLHAGECGLVSRDVLTRVGFDAGTSALALSLCLEPVVMLRKGFHDARLLRAEDAVTARQMLDLGRYRAPSPNSDAPGRS